MKFSRGFSILILLSILPSFAFAVKCVTMSLEWRDCQACAFFLCLEEGTNATVQTGCPGEFLSACSSHTKEIEFIQSKNLYDIGYSNGYVTYISGCGNEINGAACFKTKLDRFNEEFVKHKDTFKEGDLFWNDADEVFHYLRNGIEVTTTKALTNDVTSKNNGKVDDSSGSSKQNGAFKFIGIIAFGWIFLAAAWIY